MRHIMCHCQHPHELTILPLLSLLAGKYSHSGVKTTLIRPTLARKGRIQLFCVNTVYSSAAICQIGPRLTEIGPKKDHFSMQNRTKMCSKSGPIPSIRMFKKLPQLEYHPMMCFNNFPRSLGIQVDHKKYQGPYLRIF